MPAITPSKQLGSQGPHVPAMGLGLMGLSEFYMNISDRSDETRFKVLDAAHAAGQVFWDTSDAYGDNEDLVGQWFQKTGKRDEIVLMTKFGCRHVDGVSSFNSTPEYVKEACQKSLERLGTDYIDVYFCQRPDGKTAIEKTVKAMVELKKAGIIHHLGMSQCSADTLRRAHAVHPISAVQIEYSPFFLDIEANGLYDAALELGVTLIPYSPLGRGFGTTTFNSPDDIPAGDIRRTHPRFFATNWSANAELKQKLQAVADEKGCTLPQLILAWEMMQGPCTIPIPGAMTVDQLEENLEALHVSLSEEESTHIRQLIVATPQVGGIFSAADSKALFADTPPVKMVDQLESAEDLYLAQT